MPDTEKFTRKRLGRRLRLLCRDHDCLTRLHRNHDGLTLLYRNHDRRTLLHRNHDRLALLYWDHNRMPLLHRNHNHLALLHRSCFLPRTCGLRCSLVHACKQERTVFPAHEASGFHFRAPRKLGLGHQGPVHGILEPTMHHSLDAPSNNIDTVAVRVVVNPLRIPHVQAVAVRETMHRHGPWMRFIRGACTQNERHPHQHRNDHTKSNTLFHFLPHFPI